MSGQASEMVKFLRTYPLICILMAAFTVRLATAIWSEGFIHSDDHFDTIAVAWDWLHGGLWGDDGYLRWKNKLSPTIGRFPLYTLALLAQMKFCQLIGITSLSSMMYVIRFSHALMALLPVWAVYSVTRRVTGSDRWAIAGGLVIGFHFVVPFLSVRNLIEMVGGNFWMVAICFLYCYRRQSNAKWLYLAGLATGLAWMIRFQIAFAILPVPLILWWETKQLRPAVHYSLAVGAMLLVSGFVDWWLLGRFAGSTLAYLSMNVGNGSLYETIPLLYPLLMILLLIPPFAFVALYAAGRPAFVKNHLMIVVSSVSFLIAHWLHPHQQERFILPILPAFLLIAILAVWQLTIDKGWNFHIRGWPRRLLGTSIIINAIFLIAATFSFGHKGMIEPLKWLETNAPSARVLFMQPDVKRWVPIEYAGEALSFTYLRKWEALPGLKPDPTVQSAFDFFVVYPKSADRLPGCLDSLQVYFGPVEPIIGFAPSVYDRTLHFLNPNHNDDFAAYIYRPSGGIQRQPDVTAGQ